MVGNVIKICGVDLLVLDERDGNPLVLAFDLGMKTKFSNNSNDYRTSILRKKIEDWFSDSGIKSIKREIDLITMDGYTGYGKLMVDVAPLTFDEYRKYASIIKKHIKDCFWLTTGWSDPNENNCYSNAVCYVNNDGTASYTGYYYSIGLVFAFILDKNEFKYKDLSGFTTDELLAEISKRVH